MSQELKPVDNTQPTKPEIDCPYCKEGSMEQDEKKCSCYYWCGKDWCPSAPASDDEELGDDEELDDDLDLDDPMADDET